MKNFRVIYRNYGHWDICDEERRIYIIRGGPGRYWVSDKVVRGVEAKYFKTLSSCMSYVCDELMFELIVADGQKPTLIESWNV